MRIRFESCYAGISAKGTGEEWKDIADICGALVVVDHPTVPGACVPCEANPVGLVCRCKGARKTGICYHILFTTHMILKDGPPEEKKAIHNLKDVNQKIDGAKKGAKRPKKVKHCLLREDSDDEKDEQKTERLRLRW